MKYTKKITVIAVLSFALAFSVVGGNTHPLSHHTTTAYAAQPETSTASTAEKNSAMLTPEAQEKLDKELAAMVGEKGTQVPGIGVILFKDGKEVYANFLGRRTVDAEHPENDKPMTRDARFRVGALSEIFTAFTALKLQDEGKFDLSRDVGKYLGFSLKNPVYPDINITGKQLLNHTSTLRDGKISSLPPAMTVLAFFRPASPYFEDGAHYARNEMPGTHFTHADLNYGLLGNIIERTTKQRFDIYQKEHIFKSLGIRADYVPANFSPEDFALLGAGYEKKDAAGNWDENADWQGAIDDFKGVQPEKDSLMLQNHAKSEQGTYSLKNSILGTNATMYAPGGGLRISADELSHALELILGNGTFRGERVLSRNDIRAMETPPIQKNKNGEKISPLTYGLGEYQILGIGTENGQSIDLVGNAGNDYGIHAGLFRRLGTRDGFIYIMNGEAISPDDPQAVSSHYGDAWQEKVINLIASALWDAK